jgi:hypothetical protein
LSSGGSPDRLDSLVWGVTELTARKVHDFLHFVAGARRRLVPHLEQVGAERWINRTFSAAGDPVYRLLIIFRLNSLTACLGLSGGRRMSGGEASRPDFVTSVSGIVAGA